ncbi:MAG: glutamate-1-semialdehyde 2,1-aminomutase [Rhodothermaceae bacterium]|nr:glutamate-1-semialdehyde 2,1-aminomutase [Rhodothermaceae bacterium]
MKFTRSNHLRRRAHQIIPGGCHTYAKGDDQYPELSPGFIVRGKGSHVFDVDGNEFIEYGMGLRAVTLGHGYERVADAASKAMYEGINFLRPSLLELEYAEELLDVVPGAEMVKFGKHGSDATTAALKLARAYTGREMVAIPAQQPFLSVDDWFIGSTAMPGGIPESQRALTVKFDYNDLNSLESLFEAYPGSIACVIMEAAKEDDPDDNYLQSVKDLCHKYGALFVIDEMITGFRWDIGGAQKYYNIDPDLSTFGKAMANGFSVSALMGKRDIMNLGGLNHNRERVFLMSTTHGAETHALAAARETLRVYKELDVIGELWQKGAILRDGIQAIIDELRLNEFFELNGKDCCLVFGTRDQDRQRSQPFRTLFMQETIKRGLLMPSLIVSYAHTESDLKYTIEMIGEALVVYKKALGEGISKYLIGRSVAPVFRPYNSV